MGIIDVIVEKPAFKRSEGEEKTAEETRTATQTSAAEQTTSGGPRAAEANSRSGRPLLKTIGALAVAALGTITFRKLRNRRAEPGGESEGKRETQTEME